MIFKDILTKIDSEIFLKMQFVGEIDRAAMGHLVLDHSTSY